jgi:putative hydrolase of the HAD superfamily
MVGDRYGHDIEGASALGLSAIAYGEEAAGKAADHVVADLREIPEIVGIDG